jgi:hypothetical protein
MHTNLSGGEATTGHLEQAGENFRIRSGLRAKAPPAAEANDFGCSGQGPGFTHEAELMQTFGFDICRVRERPKLIGIGEGRKSQ